VLSNEPKMIIVRCL